MKLHSALLLAFALTPAFAADVTPVLSAGRIKLQIDSERGGVPLALWFDLNGDSRFSEDERMLAKTGEKRFRDRLLANLALVNYDRGIYPRDREKWTGTWGTGTRVGRRIQGTSEGVHTMETSEAEFSWNPIPALIRALALSGVRESDVRARQSPDPTAP